MPQQHYSDCQTEDRRTCLQRLSSIEAKVDMILKHDEDYETRLRVLEQDRNQSIGKAKVIAAGTVALSGCAAALVSYLLNHLKHP